VVVDDGQVIGYCATEAHMITLLKLDANFNRQGCASALLDNVEKELFLTHDELSLESFEHNDVENRFYLNHGGTRLENS